MNDINNIEEKLKSSNKSVRLKALKLMLRHPDASLIQLIKCLCSSDNRNFEFLNVFEMHSAMREAWKRLSGIDDEESYSFLLDFYQQDKEANLHIVDHILEKINTKRAHEMRATIRYK